MSPQRIEAHLDMLLGNPKEGLIEAVKTLIAERDELRTKNAEQVLMVEAEWKVSAEVDARYEDARAEVERLRGLLREACDLLPLVEAGRIEGGLGDE